jgi:hypothetical protein
MEELCRVPYERYDEKSIERSERSGELTDD